jgi:hypothetical protein
MTRNLETADLVVKLILALGVVIFYFTGVIDGPVAQTLMILGLIVLLIFTVKTALTVFTRD